MDGVYGFIVFAIVIVIIVLINKRSNRHNIHYHKMPPIHQTNYTIKSNIPVNEKEIKDRMSNVLSKFNEDNFKRFVEMVYVRYLASITEKNISIIEKYLHEQMLETHKSYLSTIKIANRNINIENIIVNGVTFLDYKKENDLETVRVKVLSRMNEYETDQSGLVISGYRSRIVTKEDVLTFQRDYNKLYNGSTIVCPCCMANLSSTSKRCDYCGTLMKYDDKSNEGWLLSDITTL